MPFASSRAGWPLLFSLKRCTIALLDQADYVYDLEREFNAPGEVVIRTFFDNALANEWAGVRGFTWHATPGEFRGATIDEDFVYLSLRLRTIVYEPGVRLAMSIERCSLPLGREMLEVLDTTPLPGGRCHVRWRIAVRYLPGMSFVAPAVTPLFRKMFEQILAAVERRVAG
jgi:hypothetical protein